jgi:hypothetical protein
MKKILIAVVMLAAVIGVLAWCEIYRVTAQPSWITSDQRNQYFYGSVGSTRATGLPYWMWLAMPRLFPEHIPGPGGYAALGLSWEEGREMPIGFAKQRVGYIRVTGNCSLCHATSRFNGQDQAPDIFPAVKGHVTNLQPLLKFYSNCAKDPRFNADEFFSEINTDTKLSWFDKLLYRYVLIPRIQKELIDDPAAVLFSPQLRAHSRDPHAEGPISDPQMTPLKIWIRQQMQKPASP